MNKLDCKMIACVYAIYNGCAIGESKEGCAYNGNGSCKNATCECCAREGQEGICPKLKGAVKE